MVGFEKSGCISSVQIHPLVEIAKMPNVLKAHALVRVML